MKSLDKERRKRQRKLQSFQEVGRNLYDATRWSMLIVASMTVIYLHKKEEQIV